MTTRFPATNASPRTLARGAAGAAVSLTPEESRYLIATGDVVAPTALVNTVAPALSGTATVGQTLSCTQGTWTGANGVYTYEWQKQFGSAGWNNIPSGNGASTFVLTSAELGATVRCRVRGINGAGAVFGASNATAAVS